MNKMCIRDSGYNPLAVIDAFRRKRAVIENREGPVLLDTVTYRYVCLLYTSRCV